MAQPPAALGQTEEEEDIGPPPATLKDEEAEEKRGGETERASEPPPEDDTLSLYQLKWVEWRGNFAPVITQNVNGPCPLIALCNVLLLSSRMKLSAGDVIVTSTHLMDLLGTIVMEDIPEDLSEGERANYEQNIQDAIATFPKLQTGLDVNVKYNSVCGFEFTSEIVIFDLLNVRLYHGWLPDPQDQVTYKAVKELSYNQLVEKVISGHSDSDTSKQQEALAADLFLQSAANQLTYTGLCELGSTMMEGELAVFFRNNHFSTVLKRKTHLLELVTDHGFVNEHGHVWQTLSSTDGDEHFMDGHFRLTEHSETQQRRVEGVSSEGVKGDDVEGEGVRGEGEEAKLQATPTPSAQLDADYQAALSLQQAEYRAEEEEEEEKEEERVEEKVMKNEDFESLPPSSAEDYERLSQMDRRRQRRRQHSEPSLCALS